MTEKLSEGLRKLADSLRRMDNARTAQKMEGLAGPALLAELLDAETNFESAARSVVLLWAEECSK